MTRYDGAASKRGVLVGDYIVEIEGVDVRGMVAADVDAVLAKHAIKGGSVSLDVVVNYDMQNFEELINPEVPSAMMLSPEKVSMPGNWNTMRSKKGGLNLAGKIDDVQ
jgi:hypothetical protein